jgi:hypothetical protein
MARIETPVKDYTGDGPGGIHFVDGVGLTDDPAIINYCRGPGTWSTASAATPFPPAVSLSTRGT